jgi:hypothetical protein
MNSLKIQEKHHFDVLNLPMALTMITTSKVEISIFDVVTLLR